MRRTVVAIGASAGGVEALREVVAGLPAAFPASVLVVLHLPAYSHSVLPDILSRDGRLPAIHATNGGPLAAGHIFVAPPDHHLLLGDGRVLLTQAPAERAHRPAIDALFRSVAEVAGPAAVGVVLSGVLDDGAAGLAAIAARGGAAVVQDPADAAYDAMPRHALERTPSAVTAPAAGIAAILARLVTEELPAVAPPPG